MRRYDSDYHDLDDLDNQFENSGLQFSPDPDDASWNPGNLDTHNADEESLNTDSYTDDDIEWDAGDYDEE